jgi:polyphenol oxidase
MIERDQPTIFADDVFVAVSSIEDGNMSFKRGDFENTLINRKAFFEKVGLDINQASLLHVTFEQVDDFTRYETLTEAHKGEGMLRSESETIADAVVVTRPDHAIFLPVADCTATVIYDTKQRILMMSHLGRQSTEMYGAQKSIEYLTRNFDTNPRDVKVWLSPAVGKKSYQLPKLDNEGLHEAIYEQLISAGVLASNIQVSSVDTAQDTNYYSHSQFTKGNRPTDYRFAVVAVMREQGEPAS